MAIAGDTSFPPPMPKPLEPCTATAFSSSTTLWTPPSLIARPEPVTESDFIEVFVGSAPVTNALCLHARIVSQPWDLSLGDQFDVLKHGEIFLQALGKGLVQSIHLATPCQSFSKARNPPLRSTDFPEGLPNLTSNQQVLVDTGNSLAAFTAAAVRAAIKSDLYFSVENPQESYLWIQPLVRQISAEPGVGYTRVFYNHFGMPWLKPTVFMHNTPTLHELAEGTGEVTLPSVRLRGMVCVEGQMVFRTALASTYPVQLAEAYARLLADALLLKEESARLGLPVPLMPLAESAGCPMGSEVFFGGATLLSRAEVRRLGEVSGVSSKSAASPCVPDGFGQPRGMTVDEQVLWMQALPHPLDLDQLTLDQDLREAVEFEQRHTPQAIDAVRSSVLSRFTVLAQELQQEQVDWALEAPEPIRGLVSKIHGPLILALMQEMDYEDPGLLHDLQQGFPYVGQLPSCGIAVRPGIPQPLGFMTLPELRAIRKDSNGEVVHKLRSTEWDDDVMRQTLDDVEFGAMAGPWPLDTVETCRISLCRRLPVREERGSGWRTRVVDHKTESSVNFAI